MDDGAATTRVEDPDETGDRSHDDRAYEAIHDLIDREHAVVWHEVEARLSERPTPERIDPHHLSNARRRLLDDDVIEIVVGKARGGRPISVLGLRNRRRRTTAFDRAAGRKRLLETRYLSWAGSEINAIGSAGELVSHASLAQAAAEGIGYSLLGDGRGIRRLPGITIPDGSIDDAAMLIGGDPENPIVLTVMIEVKNLRPWLYPAAVEIYQLLAKAATIQQQHPDRHITPVLVVRRVHYLTYLMAKHLGFLILNFDNAAQPIRKLESIDPAFVEEVRQELGYDLRLTEGDSLPGLQGKFRYTIPNNATATAQTWARMGPPLERHFHILRDRRLTGPRRETAVDALYRDAIGLARPRRHWRTPPRKNRTPF